MSNYTRAEIAEFIEEMPEFRWVINRVRWIVVPEAPQLQNYDIGCDEDRAWLNHIGPLHTDEGVEIGSEDSVWLILGLFLNANSAADEYIHYMDQYGNLVCSSS